MEFPLLPVDAGDRGGLISRTTVPEHEAPGRENFMPEGYCVKCKAKKEIVEGVEYVMKNGRKAIRGKCPTCGTVMIKILGGKATPPPEPAAPTNPTTPPTTAS